ncbi:hypothetical protein HZB90_03150, partial [archaeon]|nr:hypothetical protein [archaeon]
YEKRFDVTMNYKIIDRETQGTVLEKSETLALSTTLENIVTFDVPEDMKAGKYVLRADATYKEFTATSGFIFDILPKELAKERIEEIRKIVPEVRENITEIPELAPTVPEAPEVPVERPTPIPAPEAPFYEGKTRQQAFEMVKAVSVREPQRAVDMCKTLRIKQHQDDCIITIAKFKKDGAYCLMMSNQDRCLLELVLETNDQKFCSLMKDTMMKSNCDIIAKAKKAEGSSPEEASQLFQGFGLEVTPVLPEMPRTPQFETNTGSS